MADVKKITKKQYFEALRGLVETQETVGDYAIADVLDFIDTSIAQIDAKAAKEKERAAAKKAEGDALKEAVYAALTDEFQTGDVITAAVVAATGDEELSKAKVTARLTQLVADGKAVKEQIKDAKKMGYKLADCPEG